MSDPFPPPLPPSGEGRLGLRERWGRAAWAVLPWGVLAAGGLPGVAWTAGWFRSWTGLPCPFCGGTRAMRALLAGEIAEALYLNPLALPVVLGVAVFSGWMALEAGIGRRLWASKFHDLHQRGLQERLFRLGWIGLALFWLYHAAAAIWLPKPELLDAGGWVWRLWER